MVLMLLCVTITHTNSLSGLTPCLSFCIPTLSSSYSIPPCSSSPLLSQALSHHCYYLSSFLSALGLWATPQPQFLLFSADTETEEQLSFSLWRSFNNVVLAIVSF